jgi:hypothetical protein
MTDVDVVIAGGRGVLLDLTDGPAVGVVGRALKINIKIFSNGPWLPRRPRHAPCSAAGGNSGRSGAGSHWLRAS